MTLHRYTVLVAAATLLLIVAGALVTSTGSGLAVPDWPTSYGHFMFTFPLSSMVGGIFYEHGHRLIASTVGLLTIGLAIWTWWAEARAWVTRLAALALGAVILQGILGGLTVLFFLPAPISISHAALAQLFFCLVVSLAVFTSPGWQRGYAEGPAKAGPHDPQVRLKPDTTPARRQTWGPPLGGPSGEAGQTWGPPLGGPSDDTRLRKLAIVTTALVYLQILVGATMRHTGAGLAIPDFPLAFGWLVPPAWSGPVAIHFAHRAGAVVVAAAALALATRVWRHHRQRKELVRPAISLMALVVLQITLGGWTVLSGKAVAINSAHVAVGALVLASSLVITLRAHRAQFATDMPRVEPSLSPLATVAELQNVGRAFTARLARRKAAPYSRPEF